MGISGCKDAELKAEIERAGLPLLNEGKEKPVQRLQPFPLPASGAKCSPSHKTRLIDLPVRSGQRIYAPNCDLIVTSHVSAALN